MKFTFLNYYSIYSYISLLLLLLLYIYIFDKSSNRYFVSNFVTIKFSAVALCREDSLSLFLSRSDDILVNILDTACASVSTIWRKSKSRGRREGGGRSDWQRRKGQWHGLIHGCIRAKTDGEYFPWRAHSLFDRSMPGNWIRGFYTWSRVVYSTALSLSFSLSLSLLSPVLPPVAVEKGKGGCKEWGKGERERER